MGSAVGILRRKTEAWGCMLHAAGVLALVGRAWLQGSEEASFPHAYGAGQSNSGDGERFRWHGGVCKEKKIARMGT